jgi:hypothetical protein
LQRGEHQAAGGVQDQIYGHVLFGQMNGTRRTSSESSTSM